MKNKTAVYGSVLLQKQNEWEVRLTPMNKIFVLNTEHDTTQWPYLDKKNCIKFEVVHSGGKRTNEPPQEVMDTVKRLLLAKRNIRQHHSDDFKETETQYVYS